MPETCYNVAGSMMPETCYNVASSMMPKTCYNVAGSMMPCSHLRRHDTVRRMKQCEGWFHVQRVGYHKLPSNDVVWSLVNMTSMIIVF